MEILNKKGFSKIQQYFFGIGCVVLVSTACYALSDYIHYRTVALLLLVTVSIVAMFFDIFPVLIAAILSALIWDFFFIPPKFTFSISSTEDILMFLMYFVIALVNAVLTFKIRATQNASVRQEERETTLKLYNTILNSLSHELRTPIATVIGATDNLQNNSEKLSAQNKTDLLNEISNAGLRLNRQVENLLNMSRLESGVIRPKKDWCDVNELVYEVVNHLQDNIKEHKVKVIIPDDLPLFKLDYGIMEQVLSNLVCNAALYTQPRSSIIIRALCDNDHLILIVEDTGPGFPDADIKNVFDKFYRITKTQTGGTGLGLSIVKGFIEAHNGKIKLENRPEDGARFTITIPAETSYISKLKNE